MNQINFRVSQAEHEMIEMVAKISGKSIPTLFKQISLSALAEHAKKMALELYKSHKIGLKQAWILSQMTFPEFLSFLVEQDVEPEIPEKLDEEMVELAETLTLTDLFPNKTLMDLRKHFL
ncbi:hypothetical protein [Candidatus Lokiarchaeum ossiferum]|uniref:hypothetical protein n=1 Tax=Candidatus Lokiarchaeum ossiferum TaxID=2951803 RepID=UPI00352D8628